MKNKKIVVIIFAILILVLAFFLLVFPRILFSQNEKKMLEAGKRYYELNQNELPSGERVATVTLNKLYKKSIVKNDLYIPYTHKVCSIDNSWVKVKYENGKYNYYTYLECGRYKSNIDHTGPVIKLKGESVITVGLNEEFTDPGIESIEDAVDGRIDSKTATITSKVNTSKIGQYEISYVAFDNLKNRTEVKRTVNIVQTIYSTVKKELGEKNNYVGEPINNYVRLSNMLFRIYGIDSNNDVVLISDIDLANVNYTKMDDWFEYFYNHLNDDTKKMIVEKEYCNMTLSEEELSTTECSSYTKKRKIYIPSVQIINSAQSENNNFLKPLTLSWVANPKDEKQGYLTRSVFFQEDSVKKYLVDELEHNFGIRPMFTIKGDSMIVEGDGLKINPYSFGETKKAKNGSKLNDRYTGEYISINSTIYRIIDTLKDGTTKVISNEIVGKNFNSVTTSASTDTDIVIYDPKNKTSVAYFINNRLAGYIDTSLFVNHEIEVPIYEDLIIYGKEKEVKKYNVKLSAPNMYELFSTKPEGFTTSEGYWLINQSEKERYTGVIYKGGVPFNTEIISNYTKLNVKVVGFVNKNAVITGGLGTLENPYIVEIA